jgi:hypothetical protein
MFFFIVSPRPHPSSALFSILIARLSYASEVTLDCELLLQSAMNTALAAITITCMAVDLAHGPSDETRLKAFAPQENGGGETSMSGKLAPDQACDTFGDSDAANYCTVRLAVPRTLPSEALIVVLPLATAVANPAEVIVATPELLEFQVTDDVMSPKEPSEYVAVAAYCCCVPTVRVWLCGLTAMLVTVLALTVSTAAGEITLPDLAVMLEVPNATAVALPAVLMVATLVAEDAQVTCPVTSPVVLLPKVPVAVYCCVAAGII